MMQKMADWLGMPPLASAHGQQVDNLIIYIHWLMIALFIGWIAYFAYAIYRFHHKRNPKADYVGVRNHASSYIEITVAVIEGVLLIGMAIPLWANAVNEFPPESESTVVQVVAQQFAWNIRYQGADHAFGKQRMDLVAENNLFGVDPTDTLGKDDVQLLNDIHVPVNKEVVIYLTSKDVIHSFKVLSMRVTQDAIPGMRIPLHFKPTKEGRYQINCAQLCGLGHSSMANGYLFVESQEVFDKWMASKSGGSASYE